MAIKKPVSGKVLTKFAMLKVGGLNNIFGIFPIQLNVGK